MSKLSGALWWQGGKRKESLQLHLWNLNSTSNSPVGPRGLSCQIPTSQCQVETSANVSNKHFALSFSMQIFKFQRSSCKLSFNSRPPPEHPGELARRLTISILGQLSAPTLLNNGIKRNKYFWLIFLPFSLMCGY